MGLSGLPLGYCTNVHPAQTLAALLEGLDRFTAPVCKRVGFAMAAGLWLARPVVDEVLDSADGPTRLANELARRGLSAHTLNAFPYGDFHAERVKQAVYLPDWTSFERLAYTEKCATVLAGLLPEGGQGSISTLPVGFKWPGGWANLAAAAERLTDCAVALARIRAETGRTIRLAIEPEPFCLAETTPEAVSLFEAIWRAADARACGAVAREHLGLCYDVCHQAVEFESPPESIGALEGAGVRINKVQVSCAIELDRPAENTEGRSALRRYIEPRYLHQVFGRLPDGRVVGTADLTENFLCDPGREFLAAAAWRIHFHVPVDVESLGPLGTTRAEVRPTLEAVARLGYSPDIEVETYTWAVLPGGGDPDLVAGLAREVEATQRTIDEVRALGVGAGTA